jgi:hypothetical protein
MGSIWVLSFRSVFRRRNLQFQPLLFRYQGLKLGMDSDVWKSELSIFVSAKNVNMDIRIRF